ncbi:hypothetical protein LZ31DRAFT_388521 [Colletotrichum somersetense]|nr:hypothetical protein LZ31DRAFT_388521 [Colletotrichum somersetense]
MFLALQPLGLSATECPGFPLVSGHWDALHSRLSPPCHRHTHACSLLSRANKGRLESSGHPSPNDPSTLESMQRRKQIQLTALPCVGHDRT